MENGYLGACALRRSSINTGSFSVSVLKFLGMHYLSVLSDKVVKNIQQAQKMFKIWDKQPYFARYFINCL